MAYDRHEMCRSLGQEDSMIAKSIRPLIVGAAIIAMTGLTTHTLAEKNQILLSATYQIASLNADSTSVSMDFSATVSNNGPKDLSGKIALNNPSVIQKIYNQFGDQSIPAGKNIKLSASVTVPREEYDAWVNRGPCLMFYMTTDRGDIKTYRIPMSGTTPAPSE
jgi:hypothetical protein